MSSTSYPPIAPRHSRRTICRMKSLFVLIAACLCTSCAVGVPASGGVPIPAPRGTLQIVGGGPQPPALVQHFVSLAGGAGRARIVVFAMASGAGERSGEAKAESFRELGAEARNIWITREQADADSIVALLNGVTGVWFGGGDQNRLARALRGSRVEAAIRQRYHEGAVVGGTSAGAAVLSRVMITGDERRPGGQRRDTTNAFITIDRDNVVTDTGFALIGNAIIDQHFVRRRRHNRLISLVIERSPHLGVGIDESTALLVHPDGRWTVEGASVAVIYDARDAAVAAASASVLGATGIRMHVLPAGGVFYPASGRATLP
jgi:cyanophycinase